MIDALTGTMFAAAAFLPFLGLYFSLRRKSLADCETAIDAYLTLFRWLAWGGPAVIGTAAIFAGISRGEGKPWVYAGFALLAVTLLLSFAFTCTIFVLAYSLHRATLRVSSSGLHVSERTRDEAVRLIARTAVFQRLFCKLAGRDYALFVRQAEAMPVRREIKGVRGEGGDVGQTI